MNSAEVCFKVYGSTLDGLANAETSVMSAIIDGQENIDYQANVVIEPFSYVEDCVVPVLWEAKITAKIIDVSS